MQEDPVPIEKDRTARGFRASIFESFSVDADGPASAEKILERLAISRNTTTKEANRLTLAALVSVALYLIKIAGLRTDLIIFDQKIFEVPYGVFLFCVAAQVTLCLSLIRSSDARIYDRYMMAVCERRWTESALVIYRTYPNESMWLDSTSHAIHALKQHGKMRAFYSLTIIPTILLGSLVLLSPLIAGIYCLIDWRQQIVSGWIDLQYYTVLVSTILAAVWVVNYTAIHRVDHDDYV